LLDREELDLRIIAEVTAVMQREMFTPPGGPTYIPRKYIVYLSHEEERQWQGEKRRGLEQRISQVLSETARELAGDTQFAAGSFAVELRVDATLDKGELRVQPVWDESESGHTVVTPRRDSPTWGGMNTAVVFGGSPEASQPAPEAAKFGVFEEQSPATMIPGTRDSFEHQLRAPRLEAASSSFNSGAGPSTDYDAPFSPHKLPPERYRIIRTLGSGGLGRIYLAYDQYLKEEVAIKVLFDNAPSLLQTLQSHLKAWKVLSRKEPERVVQLFNVEQINIEGGHVVGIVMEYMPGGTLWELAESWGGAPRNPEQLARLMSLFLQALRAVGALHLHNVLHRDLKPTNMLLDAAQSTCKLSDFELLSTHEEGSQMIMGGTVAYSAPECLESGFSVATVASDIFALGVTLYQLLSGKLPFDSLNFPRPQMHIDQPPPDLTDLNPLVWPELQQVILRCLELKSEYRPQSIDELLTDLAYVGVSDEQTYAAPVNLARLLLTYLSAEDRQHLAATLVAQQGFHSIRKESAQQQADIIQEYCYTASPYDVLAHNCTNRQLSLFADQLGLQVTPNAQREQLIADILSAVGFLPGLRKIPGLEMTRNFLESQLISLVHANTTDECSGLAHSGVAAVERTIDLLLRFYGQLFYGSGFKSFISSFANKKPWNRLTFGEKAGVLRELCTKPPKLPLPERVRQVFDWPIIPQQAFTELDDLLKKRNRMAHEPERGSFNEAQRFARQVLQTAIGVLSHLVSSRLTPRVLQIISQQEDVYGRRFYLGRDDHDHTERIFTPLPLQVGQLYLFYALTNPVRINPLIFPYELAEIKTSHVK
jgi:hypothetical protein